jgi:hypothetical protein
MLLTKPIDPAALIRAVKQLASTQVSSENDALPAVVEAG